MTTMNSSGPRSDARKKIFRATTGKTIEQQLQMASQLQAQGDDVLKTIRQMKKTSERQKEATKANTLKFEWLQEQSYLKKLEENCSKELETLLLRMYNEVSTARDSKKGLQRTLNKKNADFDKQHNKENSSTQTSTMHGSTSMAYADELEDLIRTEQLNRVALINQVSSEREQRAALKHFLMAISQMQDTDIHSKTNNQRLSEKSQANMRQLIFDAFIGRQMIEISLEDEVQLCEKDFNIIYQKVLNTLRDATGSADNKLLDQEHKITELVEAAGGLKSSDEMLRLEVVEEFRKLFAHFRDDLARYEKEFINAAAARDAAGSVEAASSDHGGWNGVDEERFLSAFSSYNNKLGTGKKPQLLYDQIALVLPSIPLEEVKRHLKFHQHFRFYQDKRKNRQRDFQRKLEEQQNYATTKFRKAVETDEETTRKLEQLKEMQQQCELQREQVSQWRTTKEAKERIERQQLEIEQMLERQKQQEEDLRWRRKHDQQKIAIDDFRLDKRLQKMAEDKLAIEEEQLRGEERAVQSIVDAQRVQYRHCALQRKLEDSKQEEVHKLQLEEQRLAKLNALKEKTPYAQIIANITPNTERTRQETATFRANVEAAQEGLSITETGLFPSNGYDCETLFKNARFKLGIALRVKLFDTLRNLVARLKHLFVFVSQNAGLNSSEYARQALANVKVCNVGAYRNHIAEPTRLW